MDASLIRAVRWFVERQRGRLSELDTLADLQAFRQVAADVRAIDGRTPPLDEALSLLESEIAQRELVQERARPVVEA